MKRVRSLYEIPRIPRKNVNVQVVCSSFRFIASLGNSLVTDDELWPLWADFLLLGIEVISEHGSTVPTNTLANILQRLALAFNEIGTNSSPKCERWEEKYKEAFLWLFYHVVVRY